MITVPETVLDIIHESTYLDEGISQGIINLSSLARIIQPEVEKRTMKEVQIGSIVMALKRYADKKVSNPSETVFKSRADLIVRSNLFEITLENSPTIINKQKQLLEYVGNHSQSFITITQGVFETTIIASHDLEPHVTTLFKNEKIISTLHNLSSITVKFTTDIVDIPGVYYIVLKSLALGGIDFTEVVSTFSEFTIILKHEYVDKAFSLIKKLFEAK
jgi:hypothetical protein